MSTVIDGVDYGPLHQLIGTWRGEKGLDVAPEPDGEDKHAYYDEITITPAGAAENAEEQNLVCVKYHQLVRKRNNGKVFHDQVGHWIYEPATGMIVHSLSIPRAVCVLAGGKLEQNGDESDVDCGGSCSPCDVGQACGQNADCASDRCEGGSCQSSAIPGWSREARSCRSVLKMRLPTSSDASSTFEDLEKR